ncbi:MULTISPECIES: hypothetical protein [unclassified Variovorax]|uniref:hypothetical protein n=1 Tax=unclassified Variovorax TaxID=663243 RepID=UPI0032E6E076
MDEAVLQELAAQVAPSPRKSRRRARTAPTLRERAWWLMRQLGQFTLEDLLTTLVNSAERNAYHSLLKYTLALERVGVVHRLKRRAPGLSTLSRGHVIWRLAQDLGRLPPIMRYRYSVVFDPNTQKTLQAIVGKDESGKTAPSRNQRVSDARHTVLQSIKDLQREDRCSFQLAAQKFMASASAGKLDGPSSAAVQACLVQARMKTRDGIVTRALPSERTLFRWLTADDLKPKRLATVTTIKPWMVFAFKLRRRMKSSTVQSVYLSLCKAWSAEWGEPISYGTLCRFLKGPYRQLTSVPKGPERFNGER